jgi:hypothetical protein
MTGDPLVGNWTQRSKNTAPALAECHGPESGEVACYAQKQGEAGSNSEALQTVLPMPMPMFLTLLATITEGDEVSNRCLSYSQSHARTCRQALYQPNPRNAFLGNTALRMKQFRSDTSHLRTFAATNWRLLEESRAKPLPWPPDVEG